MREILSLRWMFEVRSRKQRLMDTSLEFVFSVENM